MWDGVSNSLALKHLRNVRKGDRIMFYHSGDEKQIIGVMKAICNAYPDPKAAKQTLAVVDVAPLRRLHRPVTLAEIKQNPSFAGWDLVRLSRLSVMPVPEEIWKRVLSLGSTVLQ